MDIKPSEKSIYKELRVNMWQYFHYSELAGDALNEDSESTSCHVLRETKTKNKTKPGK